MNKNNFLILIGERISQKRKEKKLTQEQLAETVGVSLQTISNIECGKKAARPENIIKICMALQTTTDYILLGKKTDSDMKELIKIISALPEREYKAIEEMATLLQSKTS